MNTNCVPGSVVNVFTCIISYYISDVNNVLGIIKLSSFILQLFESTLWQVPY